MNYVIYLLAIIGGIAIVFLLTDIATAFNQWQQRIHIGRWENRRVWQKAIEKKSRQWLRHTPTVKITDQGRLILWDRIRGNYRSATIQSWQDAGLLLGLEKEDAIAYSKQHPKLFAKEAMETDQMLLAYALKKKGALSTEAEERLKAAFLPYETSTSTIPYRKRLPDYRFVDTIGMVCPFLYACGLNSLADRQIQEYDKVLLQGTFPPHVCYLPGQLPLGVFDWGRGLGWYILGLTETMELEMNQKRILHLAERLLPLQKEEGGFGCMLFNPIERFESSGTALCGILFVRAYQLSLEPAFLKAAFASEKALMKATRRNGAIDYAQGDTKGIGFYSRTFDIMPFAQGMGLYLSKILNMYETTVSTLLESDV